MEGIYLDDANVPSGTEVEVGAVAPPPSVPMSFSDWELIRIDKLISNRRKSKHQLCIVA